jgi:hypothetical protein
MIAWLINKIQAKIEHEAAKPRCGMSPFQLPRGFPLNPCCAKHDDDYIFLRENALAEAQTYGIELRRNPDWLDRYKDRVIAADQQFEACLREVAAGSYWLKLVVVAFMAIVNRVGWSVWVKGTIEEQSDIHNPYRFP